MMNCQTIYLLEHILIPYRAITLNFFKQKSEEIRRRRKKEKKKSEISEEENQKKEEKVSISFSELVSANFNFVSGWILNSISSTI